MIKRARIIPRQLFRVITPLCPIRVIIWDNYSWIGGVLRDETLGPVSSGPELYSRKRNRAEKKFSPVLELSRDEERESPCSRVGQSFRDIQFE